MERKPPDRNHVLFPVFQADSKQQKHRRTPQKRNLLQVQQKERRMGGNGAFPPDVTNRAPF